LRESGNISDQCRPVTYDLLCSAAVSFGLSIFMFFCHLHYSKAANGSRDDEDLEVLRRREAVKLMIAVLAGEGLGIATCIFSLTDRYQYMPHPAMAYGSLAVSAVHICLATFYVFSTGGD
jgi:hypothetical protein